MKPARSLCIQNAICNLQINVPHTKLTYTSLIIQKWSAGFAGFCNRIVTKNVIHILQAGWSKRQRRRNKIRCREYCNSRLYIKSISMIGIIIIIIRYTRVNLGQTNSTDSPSRQLRKRICVYTVDLINYYTWNIHFIVRFWMSTRISVWWWFCYICCVCVLCCCLFVM